MTPPCTAACRSPGRDSCQRRPDDSRPAQERRNGAWGRRPPLRGDLAIKNEGPGHQERGTWPSRAGSRTAASRVWSRARGRGCVGGHVPEPELDVVGQGPPDLRRTALGWFLRERRESLDRPHVAGVAAPAHLPRVVGPASGRVAVGVVEALVGGDPVDGAAHPRVVQVAELNKAEDQVADETRDDTAVAPAEGTSAVDGEAARLGVLGVAQDDLAGTAQALVVAVRAELGEDDELPDRAGVLGGVEALTFAPMTLLALCRQDERHSTLGHDPAPCLRGSDAVRRLAEQGQREVADGWIVTVEEPSDGVGVRHRGWGAHGPNCFPATTIPNRRKWP